MRGQCEFLGDTTSFDSDCAVHLSWKKVPKSRRVC
ncbi:hypothetical protein M3J09_000334 [Ascochyta lentis]